MILTGDAITQLQTLEPQSIQTCVTSPPYWGLRDYGVDGQLGLEKTPEDYVKRMVEVFREVKRVLKDDGTLWLNLGDSYARAGGTTDKTTDQRSRSLAHMHMQQRRNTDPPAGLKAKDLVGIPWRVAFALQADGWYLRQDIIWHKPNPMPESVTDRCTKAHEYIFLLSKSAKYYFDTIKEPAKHPDGPWGGRNARPGIDTNGGNQQHGVVRARGGMKIKRSVWTVTTKPFKGAHFATFPPDLIEPCVLAGSKLGDIVLDPFFGAGTTGLVAQKHGRRYVGIELNPAYVAIADARLSGQQLKLEPA